MRGFYEASRLLSKCYKTFPPEQDLLWHDYVRSVVVGLKLHEVVLGVNVGVKRPVVWSLLGVHWLEAHVVYADILRGTICRSVTLHSARNDDATRATGCYTSRCPIKREQHARCATGFTTMWRLPLICVQGRFQNFWAVCSGLRTHELDYRYRNY